MFTWTYVIILFRLPYSSSILQQDISTSRVVLQLEQLWPSHFKVSVRERLSQRNSHVNVQCHDCILIYVHVYIVQLLCLLCIVCCNGPYWCQWIILLQYCIIIVVIASIYLYSIYSIWFHDIYVPMCMSWNVDVTTYNYNVVINTLWINQPL